MGPLQQRLSGAFKLARDQAFADSGQILEPNEIVFEVIVEAMGTLKALPDREAGWLYSQGFWPQIYQDHETQIENYKEMMRRIVSGEESVEALLGRRAPSSAAIQRMEAVFDIFPKALIGKQRSRDWKILSFLANGQTLRQVAKLARCSKDTAADRKSVQTKQIATKLGDLMPAPLVDMGAPLRLMDAHTWR